MEEGGMKRRTRVWIMRRSKSTGVQFMYAYSARLQDTEREQSVNIQRWNCGHTAGIHTIWSDLRTFKYNHRGESRTLTMFWPILLDFRINQRSLSFLLLLIFGKQKKVQGTPHAVATRNILLSFCLQYLSPHLSVALNLHHPSVLFTESLASIDLESGMSNIQPAGPNQPA